MSRANPPLRGPMLRIGDRVRFVSPASWPEDDSDVEAAMSDVRSWGLEPELAAHALDRHGYMAGTDADRLSDLNDALRDPSVRAILTTRGGAGSYRIVDGIDLDAVRADPKPIVGFSDITNLQMALWASCGLASIHGALAGQPATADVRHLLMSSEPLSIGTDPTIATSTLSITAGRSSTASGLLVGGNLRELAGFVGTGLPTLAGTILFLEDHRHVGIGQVDRNLTQLLRSELIDGVGGIALGHFHGFDDYVDRGWTLIDVLADRLGSLGVPILGGLPAGHGVARPSGEPAMRALAIGTQATIDVDAGSLTMQSCST